MLVLWLKLLSAEEEEGRSSNLSYESAYYSAPEDIIMNIIS